MQFLSGLEIEFLLAGTISFITKIENVVYEMTFEKNKENWKDGNRSISNLRTIRSFMAHRLPGQY